MEDWEAMRILKAAHTAGLAMLDSLAQAATDLKHGSRTEALEVFERALRFFDADLKMHFDHEERALFPVLARFIGRAGPIGAMVGEHDSLWNCIDDLVEQVKELKGDIVGANGQCIARIERETNHIVWLLRSHIQKEDTMLFPLAEKTLDERSRREVDINIHTVEQLVLANADSFNQKQGDTR